MPTQPPDQEEKEGRRRGTRRGARPATLCPCESASDQSVTPGEHPELDPRDEGNAQDSEDGCRPRHVLGFASRRYHRVNQRHANRRFGHSGVVQHRDRRHHPRSSNAMRVASQPQSTMYAPQTRHAGQDHRFTRSEAEQRRPRAGAHRRPNSGNTGCTCTMRSTLYTGIPHGSERRRQALQASPPWRKSECQGTSMGWSEVGTPQGIVGLILNHLAIQKAPPATRAQRGWSRARDG